MANQAANEEKKTYLIDEKYRRITQEQIAIAMGLVASVEGSNGATLDQLAKVRSFFDRDRLYEYSKRIGDSNVHQEDI